MTQKLPPEIQGEIVRLRERGKTIDQIMAKLQELAPEADLSRSALGRHVKWLDEEFEDLRRSRQVAEHLSAALEDGRDAHSARINIQLLHNEVFELLRQTRQMARLAEEAGESAPLGERAKAVASIGRTLANVTRAARTNLDYIAAVRAEAAEVATKEAAGRAADAAKAQGMSADTAEFIKAFVLGVKAP
ncbi:phage protein Gp27 family protein [Falsiroseomonas sp.]|uniref:phage protein Gp27 family protein n=1 Tax=Falsiroseomonas sp. TaxID=2870721 RepID=UPI003F6FC262